jgi:hypothetical protein
MVKMHRMIVNRRPVCLTWTVAFSDEEIDMSYYLGTVIFFTLWIGGCFLLGRWGRRKGSYNTETLAWLMGGIAVLMGIFATLSMELRYLKVL